MTTPKLVLTIAGEIFLVLFGLLGLLACAVLLFGCAAPTVPYTVEHPVAPFSAAAPGGWLADGPGKVLTVRNPLLLEIEAEVVCASGGQAYGPPRWVVRVPAGGEVRGLAQVENRDQISNVCRVARYTQIRAQASP